MPAFAVGQKARIQRTVGPGDTADRFGNPGVEVLATPVLCHWFESVAVACISAELGPGEATVGTRLAIEHLAATPLGGSVTIDAELVEVDRRRLAFRIEARDAQELIARGTHERFVIDLAGFLKRTQAKAETLSSLRRRPVEPPTT